MKSRCKKLLFMMLAFTLGVVIGIQPELQSVSPCACPDDQQGKGCACDPNRKTCACIAVVADPGATHTNCVAPCCSK